MFWKLILEDGSEVTEKDVTLWDNVSQDVVVRAAIFDPERPPHSTFDKFDKICIAKLGALTMGGDSIDAGYVVNLIKGNIYLKVTFRGSTIHTDAYDVSEVNIPEEYFRQGVK